MDAVLFITKKDQYLELSIVPEEKWLRLDPNLVYSIVRSLRRNMHEKHINTSEIKVLENNTTIAQPVILSDSDDNLVTALGNFQPCKTPAENRIKNQAEFYIGTQSLRQSDYIVSWGINVEHNVRQMLENSL
tara:strand:- start:1950 stop:2345 length:396 start_codon:yes stop_codon:yes gene_type:complete